VSKGVRESERESGRDLRKGNLDWKAGVFNIPLLLAIEANTQLKVGIGRKALFLYSKSCIGSILGSETSFRIVGLEKSMFIQWRKERSQRRTTKNISHTIIFTRNMSNCSIKFRDVVVRNWCGRERRRTLVLNDRGW
jgi:hypothetical protein